MICKKVLRDVRERGRDIEGCIKQWFGFVKPNFHKFVEPQRDVAGKHSLRSLSQASLPHHDDFQNQSIVHPNHFEETYHRFLSEMPLVDLYAIRYRERKRLTK